MKVVEVLEFKDPGDILISMCDEAEELARLEVQMHGFYSKPSPPFLRNLSKGQISYFVVIKVKLISDVMSKTYGKNSK